ncbi:MAG: hypothetical protein NC911_08510, partial [Candidatus Omnitrophica bacterium]|nr:hypothetical protein [Candidatus Omnitrophota bacterium]
KTGDEVKYFRKKIYLPWIPEKAEVKFTSLSPAVLFVNGQFIEGSSRRYLNRVNRYDLTRKLKKGNNVVSLRLLISFSQNEANQEYQKRRYWISPFVLIALAVKRRQRCLLLTVSTWKAWGEGKPGWTELEFDDRKYLSGEEIKQVTEEEFRHSWEPAALWQIPDKPAMNEPADFVGKE